MKKVLLSVFLLASKISYSQSGINTKIPKATFDITSMHPDSAVETSAEGLLIPRISRIRAQNMVAIEESTLIYINDITNGSLLDKTELVDEIGFYYYNGSQWIKLKSLTSANPSQTIENGLEVENDLVHLGGNLIKPTTIVASSSDNVLQISGNYPNVFSVNDAAFSVDGLNNYVGIGTVQPTNSLDINGDLRIRTINEVTKTNFLIAPNETGVIQKITLDKVLESGVTDEGGSQTKKIQFVGNYPADTSITNGILEFRVTGTGNSGNFVYQVKVKDTSVLPVTIYNSTIARWGGVGGAPTGSASEYTFTASTNNWTTLGTITGNQNGHNVILSVSNNVNSLVFYNIFAQRVDGANGLKSLIINRY